MRLDRSPGLRVYCRRDCVGFALGVPLPHEAGEVRRVQGIG